MVLTASGLTIQAFEFITSASTTITIGDVVSFNSCSVSCIDWLSLEQEKLISDFKERITAYRKALFTKKPVIKFTTHKKLIVQIQIPASRTWNCKESRSR